MNLGRKSCWFESLSTSSLGVLVEASDFDETNVDVVLKNILENLDYNIGLNDETVDPFKENIQLSQTILSFLELMPILGRFSIQNHSMHSSSFTKEAN